MNCVKLGIIGHAFTLRTPLPKIPEKKPKLRDMYCHHCGAHPPCFALLISLIHQPSPMLALALMLTFKLVITVVPRPHPLPTSHPSLTYKHANALSIEIHAHYLPCMHASGKCPQQVVVWGWCMYRNTTAQAGKEWDL